MSDHLVTRQEGQKAWQRGTSRRRREGELQPISDTRMLGEAGVSLTAPISLDVSVSTSLQSKQVSGDKAQFVPCLLCSVLCLL